MMSEARKIAVFGITGVFLACLVFTVIALVPWSDLEKASTTTKNEALECLHTPIRVNLSISSFEPPKLGGEAKLTVTVVHVGWDSPHTHVSIYVVEGVGGLCVPPEERGLVLVGENLTWSGYLKANIPVTLNVKVKANKVGNWTIEGTAKCFFAHNIWYGNMEDLRVSVSEDEILVVPLGSPLKDPLGQIKMQIYVSNVTEPQGVGCEADLIVLMEPYTDIFNATAEITLSEGIGFVRGDLTWSGDLKANTSISFRARIKAMKVGNWVVSVSISGIFWARIPEFGGTYIQMPLAATGTSLLIHVFEDKIAVSKPLVIYY